MHLVEAVGLVDVSVLGILDLLWRIPHKVVRLQKGIKLPCLCHNYSMLKLP